MPLKLMYITNRYDLAKIAEKNNVDRVFVDLEIKGKEKRQGHLDTVISRHCEEDIANVKKALKNSKLIVRVNPINEDSKREIENVISSGADIVMLPYFKTSKEAAKFIEYVDSKAKTCLLFETPAAVDNIDEILLIPGIDEVHIGLNDLHLGYGLNFMFEPFINGMVEKLSTKFKEKNIPFGVGGIAGLNKGKLPANYIIAEHYRIGSEMAILSRSFLNAKNIEDIEEVDKMFYNGVNEIREYEKFLLNQNEDFYKKNYSKMEKIIIEISKDIKKSKLQKI